MTKQQILTRLSIKQADMARIFGISTSAVAQWEDDKPIPKGRYYELKAKNPAAFIGVADPIEYLTKRDGEAA